MAANGADEVILPRSMLQRPHPPQHDTVSGPGMSRTVTRSVPRHAPPHPHIHHRTSEAASHSGSHFTSSQVSHADSCQTPGSKASVERVGDCYHSNGPSVEGHLNQVIRYGRLTVSVKRQYRVQTAHAVYWHAIVLSSVVRPSSSAITEAVPLLLQAC